MRIISLAPSNTEILYALGAEDSIIACTRYCDFPEQAKKKDKIGGWLDINYEKVINLNPDMIMTSTFVQDKIVKKLSEKGIKVAHYDPKNLEDVFESIMDIGSILEKTENAKEIVRKMKNSFKDIKSSKKINAYIEEWLKPTTVSGNWVPDIIEIAGGKSLIKSGEISREVSEEEVRKFNPDVMIVSWCGFGSNIKKDMILKRNWDFIDKDKIFIIDDSLLNRPGPRLVEGAKKLKEIFEKIK